jgi:hypothetical protein
VRGTTDTFVLQGLAQAVQALAGKLTDAHAQQAGNAVLQAIPGTTDPFVLAAKQPQEYVPSSST